MNRLSNPISMTEKQLEHWDVREGFRLRFPIKTWHYFTLDKNGTIEVRISSGRDHYKNLYASLHPSCVPQFVKAFNHMVKLGWL